MDRRNSRQSEDSFMLFGMREHNNKQHKGLDYGNGHLHGPAVDLETAIRETGYGWYHFWLLMICGSVYMTCAIGTTTLSFVLPAAECDFSLDSAEKGEINATPLVGMIFGSYVWGSMADTRGRKSVLVISMTMDFVAALLSSLAPNLLSFLACRFFNGFGIIGATSVVFPYMSEFLAYKHRDLNLCRLELFWVLGVCAVPGLAWIVIPLPITWTPFPDLILRSWRLFVFFCGVPSLVIAIILHFFFMETPKFLLSRGHHDEALEVLRKIFVFNKKRPVSEYCVHRLAAETYDLQLNEDGSPVHLPLGHKEPKASLCRQFANRMKVLWEQNVALFSGPLAKYTLLACFIDFGIMSSYYTLMLWFPELLERFSSFNHLHGEETEVSGVCDVMGVVMDPSANNCTSPDHMHGPDNEVYLHTLIIGLSCLPTSLMLGYLVRKMGTRIMLTLFMTTAGISILCLHLIHNEMQNLVLSCVFEALASVAEATLFCAVVHIFPTHLRALAVSLTVTCGRIGAVLGNILLGILLDFSCVVPITTFGVLLIASGLLCLALPKPSGDHPRHSICSHAL
ncbi:synaptic vesicle glycoprotein 2B-like [Neocloeon triangulifer]|uniref:synaptic vesicle glycoprotein 2B-like n=1 Tax=Neocloeon triangulifer TaxID=2078957 RepID=UPI00286F79B3|nr:synaptic vesicle glycoprotein 2B-like [Neocloeon triangulifer]